MYTLFLLILIAELSVETIVPRVGSASHWFGDLERATRSYKYVNLEAGDSLVLDSTSATK
jgi:hypothetical protein